MRTPKPFSAPVAPRPDGQAAAWADDGKVTVAHTCACGAYLSVTAHPATVAAQLLHDQVREHQCHVTEAARGLTEALEREPVDVVAARKVILDAIRRHPVSRNYLLPLSMEAHAAGIVVALAEAGHLR